MAEDFTDAGVNFLDLIVISSSCYRSF
jgi:hypothetical protein